MTMARYGEVVSLFRSTKQFVTIGLACKSGRGAAMIAAMTASHACVFAK